MNKLTIACIIGIAFIALGCSNNTYNSLRQQEDKLIANYINRNGLTIVYEEPAINHVWAEKEYYKVSGYDNFYFHLIQRGDSVRVDQVAPGVYDTVDLAVKRNDIIITRYKQFELTENADTLSYWTTLDQAYPYQFAYQNLSDCECVAWHLAVQLMKYPDSQCEIIVPSKLGFSTPQSTVTPYGYILKIKVKQ